MKYKEIGLYIRNQRKKMGKSLNEFAIEIDVDSAILSRIENQKQDIKLAVLCKIAKGFGKKPSEFLLEYEEAVKTKKI